MAESEVEFRVRVSTEQFERAMTAGLVLAELMTLDFEPMDRPGFNAYRWVQRRTGVTVTVEIPSANRPAQAVEGENGAETGQRSQLVRCRQQEQPHVLNHHGDSSLCDDPIQVGWVDWT